MAERGWREKRLLCGQGCEAPAEASRGLSQWLLLPLPEMCGCDEL